MTGNKAHRTETVVGISILLVLAGISTGIFYQQFHLNPAVLSIESTESMIPGDSIPMIKGAMETLLPLPDHIVPMTPAETFGPDNLSDKINGKAELYLSAGFLNLKSQRFAVWDRSDLWMELFLYDMGSSENAYAVFSGQRRADAAPLKITPYAYRTDSGFFLAHGPYYVEIIAAGKSAALVDAMQATAEAFVENNKAPEIAFDPVALFPGADLDRSSITLLSKDAFGYTNFNQVYIADYQMDDTILTAFVSRQKTSERAEAVISGYREFLLSFGGKDMGPEFGGQAVTAVEILGAIELFFSHGPYVAGVHESLDPDRATQLARRLNKHLLEVGGDL